MYNTSTTGNSQVGGH